MNQTATQTRRCLIDATHMAATGTGTPFTHSLAWLMEPQAGPQVILVSSKPQPRLLSLAKGGNPPVMKLIPVRHGRIDGGPADDDWLQLLPQDRLSCFVSATRPVVVRGVTPLSGGRLRHIDFVGSQIHGRMDGVSLRLPSCASQRRRQLSHPLPPAHASRGISGPISSTSRPVRARTRDQ
jgi:hypothetical protein